MLLWGRKLIFCKPRIDDNLLCKVFGAFLSFCTRKRFCSDRKDWDLIQLNKINVIEKKPGGFALDCFNQPSHSTPRR
jgi:hypothetical protein